MIDRLDYYDLLGIIVPGTLLLCWFPICFPGIADVAASVRFPEAFGVIALVVAALFLGHVVQSLASTLEPLLFKTFGGRPSDVALSRGLGARYLPEDAAQRIRAKLMGRIGSEASLTTLFLYAMQCAEHAGSGRVSRFNCLYAYHRALVVLMLIASAVFFASLIAGAAADWPCVYAATTLVLLLGVLFIAWFRARQRAFYYVREVLLTAERMLDGESPSGEAP